MIQKSEAWIQKSEVRIQKPEKNIQTSDFWFLTSELPHQTNKKGIKMSFIEIRKSLGRKQYMSGVWVGIRKMKGRLGIIIIIRPDILQKMDIKVGDMVTVLRGEEEHRGILCLKKGPGFVLTKHDKGGVTGKITLTAWPGIINKSLRIKKVNVSTENDQITLDISRLLASTTSGDDHEI